MTAATQTVSTQPLSLTEELMLMLINEENGYFHQVPGWSLNCAVVGAILAELSLHNRIDTTMDLLFAVDDSKTGDPILDPILEEIANEHGRFNAQYWIEHFIDRAESIIDETLDRLENRQILRHLEGGYWVVISSHRYAQPQDQAEEGHAGQYIKNRIGKVIFTDEIPDPRDILIICLIETCDVFRYIFELDEASEARIELICRMEVIGRSIGEAVKQNIASPLRSRSILSKSIPKVSLRHLLRSPNLKSRNVPALFGELTEKYGPVYELRPPMARPMTFIAGHKVNSWVMRHGRGYFRAQGYFYDLENIYGAHGLLPSLDGTDHFRLRRAMSAGYSRGRLGDSMDQLLLLIRKYMSGWKEGESYPARTFCRHMINAQLSPLLLSVESQDLIDDLSGYKERALAALVVGILPKFMLRTPAMRRKARAVPMMLERVSRVHTTAQREGCPRDLADDWLSLHASDPQLMPESNFGFVFSAALLASVYLGDAITFAFYAMASQPELYERIRGEANAIFDKGDPTVDAFTQANADVTHRFMREVLRLYPIVPMSMRDVVNSCVVEGYELKVGTRVLIAQTAPHFMEEAFPDPLKFDIDRYLPPRNEHRHPGYSPYGLGPHKCLGSRWVELQMAVNLLMVAHHFTLAVDPADYKLKYSPIPSNKPNKKLKFKIAEQTRPLWN